MFNKHLLKWVCEGDVYRAHLLAKPKEISVSLCLGFPKACMFLNIGRQRKLEGFPFYVEGRCKDLCLVPGLASPSLASVCVKFTKKPCCCNTPFERQGGKDNKLFFNCFPGYKLACIGLIFFPWTKAQLTARLRKSRKGVLSLKAPLCIEPEQEEVLSVPRSWRAPRTTTKQ